MSPALPGGLLTTKPAEKSLICEYYISEINPTFTCCMIIYCCIHFVNILLRSFASIFIKDIGISLIIEISYHVFVTKPLKCLLPNI